MSLTQHDFDLEKKRLESTITEVRSQLSVSGQDLFANEQKLREYQKMMWDNKADLDEAEMKTFFTDSEYELFFLAKQSEKFKRLYMVQNKPYFGSIIFNDEPIYIGLTNVSRDYNYYVYDWRSPIASVFYDYGVGPAQYEAPQGIIEGEVTRKRQYNITDGVLNDVIETTINIDDQVLQDVLKNNSSDKMKNIVNTIQEEQNKIIRDSSSKYMVVQGIAGSGKTSVALHRIAFLLYKIENLSSNNVLIFSPNNVFTEYISNVLPELGEKNTLDITYYQFAKNLLTEYRDVGTYGKLIEDYYQNNSQNNKLVKYKLSDNMTNLIELYCDLIIKNAIFEHSIIYNDVEISVNELNDLFKNYYNKFKLFDRLNYIAERINRKYFSDRAKDMVRIRTLLKDALNIKRDYKKILKDFYLSNIFKSGIKFTVSDSTLVKNVNASTINYEDSIILLYIKELLEGIKENWDVLHVVIDEAQDYNYLQFKLLKKVYHKANFTILGDVNQTINPYYKYESLDILKNIFTDKYVYCELTKTYRSSKEIIEYANNILDLNHVSAVRNELNEPVEIKTYDINSIVNDIKRLRNKYNSIAVITKGVTECNRVYQELKELVPDLSQLNINDEFINKELVIMPAYQSKGLEFDSVIIIDNFKINKYLYYVACTRSQHKLIIYNY